MADLNMSKARSQSIKVCMLFRNQGASASGAVTQSRLAWHGKGIEFGHIATGYDDVIGSEPGVGQKTRGAIFCPFLLHSDTYARRNSVAGQPSPASQALYQAIRAPRDTRRNDCDGLADPSNQFSADLYRRRIRLTRGVCGGGIRNAEISNRLAREQDARKGKFGECPNQIGQVPRAPPHKLRDFPEQALGRHLYFRWTDHSPIADLGGRTLLFKRRVRRQQGQF